MKCDCFIFGFFRMVNEMIVKIYYNEEKGKGDGRG
jgi:hypothetical protein